MMLFNPIAIRMATLLALIAVIAVIFQLATPVYLTTSNFTALARHMSLNGIVAIGLTFVIVVRKFDLSLAGVASFCAMSLGFTLSLSNDLTATIVSAVTVGLICGLASGLLVGLGRLPDVVTTIAVGSIAYGLAFVYNNGATFSDNFFSSGMVTMNFKTILGLPVPVFVLLTTALLGGYLMHASKFGQAFYATGENPLSAHFSGIPVWCVYLAAFGICGALVGLAMVLHVSGIGSSRVSAGGQILLPAYTSVYLGAALMGRASVGATLAGVLVMTMLLNGFTLLAVPYYYSDAALSLILIAAIVLFDPKVLTLLRNPLQFLRTRGGE